MSTLVKDVTLNTVYISNALKIPVTPLITDIPLQAKGSIVFEDSTDILKISDGNAWLDIASSGVIINAGTGISITGGNTINNTLPSTLISLTSEPTTPGLTYSLVSAGSINPNFITKTITQGTGVTITDSGTNLIVNATPLTYTAGIGISIITNIISNTGVLSLTPGTGISLSGSTGNITVSGDYIAGPGISIVGNVITNTSPGTPPIPTTLTNLGTTSLVVGGLSPNLSIKGLLAGGGITLSTTPTNIMISNSASASTVTLTSTGGTSLVSGGVGPLLSVKGLNAGSGIGIVDQTSYIDIVNTLAKYPVTFMNNSPLLGNIGVPSQWEIVGFDMLYPDWAPNGYIADFSATFIGGITLPPIVSGSTPIYTGFLCNYTGQYNVSYSVSIYNNDASPQTVGVCIFGTSNNGGTWFQKNGSLVTTILLPGQGTVVSRSYVTSFLQGSKYILCMYGTSTSVFLGTHLPSTPLGPAGIATDESVATLSWFMTQPIVPPI